MASALQLVLPLELITSLSTPNTLGSQTVRGWMRENFAGTEVIALPEAAGAATSPLGDNLIYLQAISVDDASTDGGQVWQQEVPVKSLFLGTQQKVKSYVEAYMNATAGAYCKRPFGVVRATQAPYAP